VDFLLHLELADDQLAHNDQLYLRDVLDAYLLPTADFDVQLLDRSIIAHAIRQPSAYPTLRVRINGIDVSTLPRTLHD
jgi:pyruvate-formate lyase